MVWSDLWRPSSASRSAQPSWSGPPPTLLLSVRPGAPPTTLTSTTDRPRSENALGSCAARAAISETGSTAAARLCSGARLPDFVGVVESGASDDVSGHGVAGVGEGEGVGQVGAVVKGEELEDVGVGSVGGDGHGAGPSAVAEGAFAVFESADRAGLGETVLRDGVQRRVDAE